jgi:hypothetical protein
MSATAQRRCSRLSTSLRAASKLLDVELSIRGILRGFGLKMGVVTLRGASAGAIGRNGAD